MVLYMWGGALTLHLVYCKALQQTGLQGYLCLMHIQHILITSTLQLATSGLQADCQANGPSLKLNKYTVQMTHMTINKY